MNSVNYIDNSYLFGQKTQPQIFAAKRKPLFGSIFIFPALLSLLGLVLIGLAFYPSVALSSAKIAVTSYPPPVADQIKPATKEAFVSKVIATEEIKELSVESFSPSDIPDLNLSLERIWPVRGRITTYYSWSHPGIDIATDYGTSVLPFMEGVVTDVEHTSSGFGNFIVIQHQSGFESLYGHLSRTNVEIGQKVTLSTIIGAVGQSGWATGPHLHLQIYQTGQTINPLRVLP